MVNLPAEIPYAAAGVLSYLVGAIPSGYLLVKLKTGKDIRTMGSGNIGATNVARNLGMSRRTLARHLADEGLTFSDILENLRMEMARRYLDDPGLPISRIAWLLGYQETSAFTNSFKRWTGLTPTAMRRHSGLAASGEK